MSCRLVHIQTTCPRNRYLPRLVQIPTTCPRNRYLPWLVHIPVGVLTLHWTFPRDYANRKAKLQHHGTQHKCIYVCMQVLNVQKQQKSKMTTDNHRKPSAATKRPSTNTQPAPKRVHHPDVAGPSNVPTLVCINPTCCVHHSQISITIPKSVSPLTNL